MENRRNNESKQTVISKKGPVTRIAQNRVSFLSLFKCKLLWRTSLTICQWKQESSGSILVIATSTPVVRVVSTKLCPILEGDQRDSAIELITLLVESGIGVPVNLGIVEDTSRIKEIGVEDVRSKWTALDLLPACRWPPLVFSNGLRALNSRSPPSLQASTRDFSKYYFIFPFLVRFR